MQAPKIPEWRISPEPVRIKCSTIENTERSGELIVQFKTNGNTFTSFVPETFVDRHAFKLQGAIVADFDEFWLVDLPAETLTSGPRILVPKSEDGLLIERVAVHDSV